MNSSTAAYLLCSALYAFGQTGPTLTGNSYKVTSTLVAPGQVVQLQVAGLKTVLVPALQEAATLPLPTSLAGISVTITQSILTSMEGTPYVTTYQAPMVSLNQVNLCAAETSTSADCLVTYIRAQVPYELAINPLPPPFVYSYGDFRGRREQPGLRDWRCL